MKKPSKKQSLGLNLSVRRPVGLPVGLLAVCLASAFSSASAVDGTWTDSATGGLWSNTANWSNGVVADSGSANFSTLNITTATTNVLMDASHTLTALSFADTTPSTAASWQVTNNGVVTNVLTLSGATPTITVGTMGAGKSVVMALNIVSANGLIKDGVGELDLGTVSGGSQLTGTNTFGAGILIKSGTLGITGTSSVGNTSSITIGDTTPGSSTAATLYVLGLGTSGVVPSYYNNILLGASTGPLTIAASTSGAITFAGSVTGTNNLTITENNAGTGSMTFSGGVNITGTFTNAGTGAAGATVTIGGLTPATSIGSNVQGLVQNGNTTLAITGTNAAFIGDTTVTSGTLRLVNDKSLQSSVLQMNGGKVIFGKSGTVGLSSVVLGGLSGAGNINLNDTLTTPAAVNLTIGNSNTSYGGNTLNPTYSGVLSNNTTAGATLTKVGSNTQTLTGINTYTGLTTVSAGELDLNAAGQAIAGNVTVNGGTAKLLGSNQIATSGTLAVSSGVFDIQGKTQTLAKVQLTGGSINGTTGVLTSTAAFDMQNGTVNAILSGTAGLSKTTGGTVVLNGANTYSGGTTISAGILSISSASALPGWSTPGAFSVASGATLAVSNAISDANISTLLGTNNFAAGSAVGFDTTAGDRNFTLGLTGLSGLTKTGANNLIITGSASYTGTTLVSAGGMMLGNGSTTGALSPSSAIVIASGGNLIINRSNAVAQGTDFSSAAISGSGSFTQAGSGTTTLNVANTYTGATYATAGELDLNASSPAIAGNLTVNGGTAKLLGSNQIATSGTLGVSSGVFDIQGNNQTLAKVQLTGGNINGTTGVLTSTAAYDMQAGTANAILSGTAGLSKTTAGTVILNGANTYSGGTTITSGTLQLGNATALGATTGNLALNGGALDMNGNSVTVNALSGSTGAVITNNGASGAILSATSATTTTYAGSINDGTGTLGLAQTSAGVLTLSASNNYSGGTIFNGTLTAGASGAFGTGSVTGTASGSRLSFNTPTNATFANNFYTTHGSGLGVVFTNASATSTITLTGSNRFDTGNTWNTIAGSGLSSGVVLMGTNSFAGRNLALSNVSLTAGNNNALSSVTYLVMNDSGASATDTAFYVQNGITISTPVRDSSYAAYTSARNFTLGISQSGSATLSGAIDLHRSASGNPTWSFDAVAGGTLAITNAITQTAASGATVNKTGLGTVVLTGADTYVAPTNVNAGTLELGNGSTTGGLSTSSAIAIASNANFTVNRSNLVTQGTDFSTAGITGAGSFTQAGSGTTILNAANTYTGATYVNAGTLKVNGSLTSAVTIGGGGTSGTPTLGGGNSVETGGSLLGSPIGSATSQVYAPSTSVGYISSGVTVNGASGGAAGHLAPGNSVGTLTLGTLTLNAGSVLDYEFNGSANDFTMVTTSGGLTINGGGFNLYSEGTTTPWTTTGLYDLIGYTGALTGTTSNLSVLNPQSANTYTFGTASVGGTNYITLSIGSNITATTGTYSLAASAAASRIVTGGTTAITSVITNTGSGTADTINYSGLGATGTSGSFTSGTGSGTALAQLTSGTASVIFTGGATGVQTITPTVSATNATLGGLATAGSTTTTTVDVLADRVVTATGVNLGRVMINQAVSGTSSLSTSGDDNTYTRVTVAGVTGTFNSATSTGTYVTGTTFASTGAKSGTLTLITSGENLAGEHDINVGVAYSATALANRVVTATSVDLGRVMINQAVSGTSSLSTSGDDNNYTRVTVAGVTGTFNSDSSTGTYVTGTTFASTGVQDGTIILKTTGEGLTGESPINVNVGYTATALANRVITASTVDLGNVLKNTQTVSGTSTLTSLGSHDTNTDLTVGIGTTSSNGVIVNNGSSQTFNGTYTAGTVSVSGSFAASGITSGTVSVATSGENLAGEVDAPVNVGYTAAVYDAALLTSSTSNGALTLNNIGTGNLVASAKIESNEINTAVTQNSGAWTLTTGTIAAGSNSTVASFNGAGRLNGTYTGSTTISAKNVAIDGSAIKGAASGDLLNSQNFSITASISGNKSYSHTDIYSADILSGQKYAGYSLTSGVGHGTVATLLDGAETARATTTVNMSFDTASANTVINAFYHSDVLTLGGFNAEEVGTGFDGSKLSDQFVLQMTYNKDIYTGEQYIAYYDSVSHRFVNAISGNSVGGGADYLMGGTGNYIAGAYTSADDILGYYGYDSSTGTAWAVLDHSDAEFTVVPEPSTWAMMVGGLGILLFTQRNRRRSNA